MKTGAYARKKHIFLIILIFVPIILFANTFRNPFMWDDEELILDDSYIRNLKSAAVLFSPKYWTHLRPGAKGEYRPVGTLSFAIDHMLWGFNPAGYHLTNLIVYITIVVLIYVLLNRLLLLKEKEKIPPLKHWYEGFFEIPFLSALIFASLPVHVESVTWIKNRTGLFAMLFMLLSMFFFVKHIRTGKKITSSRAYYVSVIFCFFALISHEISVSIPILFLLLSVFFVPEQRGLKKYLELAPYFLLTALFLGLKIFVLNAMVSSENIPVKLDLLTHILAIFKTYGYYLSILGFPFFLTAEHTFKMPSGLWNLDVLLSVLGIFAILVFSLKNTKRHPIASFSLLWMVISLIPASNIIPLTGRPIGEQRLLIPSLGLCILAAFLLSKTFFYKGSGIKRKFTKMIALAFSFILILSFSAKTIIRNEDWRDPIGFWIKTADAAPENSRALYNLGVAYLGGRNVINSLAGLTHSKDNIAKAKDCFIKALKLDPSNHNAHTNLGNIYIFSGSPQKAIEHLKTAADIKPSDTTILTNMGLSYEKTGDYEQAISSYLSALSADPYNADAYNNLGLLYYGQNRIDKAVPLFEKAIEIDPGHYAAYLNLANIFNISGDKTRAFELYKRSLEYDPGNITALTNLGSLLTLSGKKGEGLPLLSQALSSAPLSATLYQDIHKAFRVAGNEDLFIKKIKEADSLFPDNPDIQAILGKALLSEKEYNSAQKYITKAIELDPSNIWAMIYMGDLYMEKNLPDMALKQYEKAYDIAPDNQLAINTLAREYISQGKDEKAYSLYIKVVQKDPIPSKWALNKLMQMLLSAKKYQKALDICLSIKNKNPEETFIYIYIGDIYTAMKNYSKALSSYSKALALNPKDLNASKALAHAYSLNGNPDKAQDILNTIIKSSPEDLTSYYELAAIYNKQGNLQAAADIFKKIIRSDPSQSDALNNLGVISEKTGNLSTAIDFFNKALIVNPKHEDAYNNLGIAYINSGEKEKAIEIYQKLISVDPDYAPAYFNLGNIYYLSGDRLQALNYFNKAVKKSPDYAKAHSALAVVNFTLGNYERSLYHFDRAKELGIVNKKLEAALNKYKREHIFGS